MIHNSRELPSGVVLPATPHPCYAARGFVFRCWSWQPGNGRWEQSRSLPSMT